VSVLDVQGNAMVIRVVYDGPPFSGKTTTLRALSADLSRPLETPQEAAGRTLFFDWVDYTGGRFEGRPIRCQVVSVPGQRALRERRRRLLADADAVVFVADTGRLGLDLSLQYARELREFLARAEAPQPGVVVQANKRDVEDALEMPEVIAAFRKQGLEVGFVESTATTTAGVKEAFVFAVRLALDRARALARAGRLATGRPEVDTAEDLLEQIEPGASAGAFGRGAHARGAPTASLIDAALCGYPAQRESGAAAAARTRDDHDASQDRLPDPDVPSGLIWPPIQGRIMLQQACARLPPMAQSDAAGDITIVSGTGWRVYSRAADVFDEAETGRKALAQWARLHVRNSQWIAQRRSVVLSPRVGERWRLWQVVGEERSLQDALLADSAQISVAECVDRLVSASRQLIDATAAFRSATVRLPATLGTISADGTQPRYIGLMPACDDAACCAVDVDVDGLLSQHMSESIRSLLASRPAGTLAAGLHATAERSPRSRIVAECLRRLCAAN
jgi:signal recognition particle receptor subunit beta